MKVFIEFEHTYMYSFKLSTLCLLANIACSFVSLQLIFFKINFLKILSGMPSVSNSLDPDQAQQNVEPDLGANGLQSLSADDTSRWSYCGFKVAW